MVKVGQGLTNRKATTATPAARPHIWATNLGQFLLVVAHSQVLRFYAQTPTVRAGILARHNGIPIFSMERRSDLGSWCGADGLSTLRALHILEGLLVLERFQGTLGRVQRRIEVESHAIFVLGFRLAAWHAP